MKQLLLLATLTLALWTCHKEKPEEQCPAGLPCATQTGANTFGCYINGAPWEAKVEPFVIAPGTHKIEATYDETDYATFNDNYFRLLGVYAGDTSTSLIIHFNPLLKIGEISLDSLNFYGIRFRVPHKEFNIDPESPYEINITKLDTEQNIISGIFFFTGIYGMDTVRVTDGRFDVRYNPE